METLNQNTQNRKKPSFALYGCLTLLIIILVGAGVIAYQGYQFWQNQIVPALDPEPQIMEVPTLPANEAKDLTYKFNKQIQTLKAKQAVTMEYTQAELNYLFNHHDIFKTLNGKFVFTLTPTNIKVKVASSIFGANYLNLDLDLEAQNYPPHLLINQISSKLGHYSPAPEDKVALDLIVPIQDAINLKITELTVLEGSIKINLTPIN